MIQLQQNRYLWVHFASLAAVPLLLDVCVSGLASAQAMLSYPTSFGFLFWLIALVGILPSLWMQIARPFYVFSLPPVALRPDRLTDDQRRCLTVLTSWQIKALAVATAGFLLWLLAQVFDLSPQVKPLFMPTAGLVLAVVAFFFVCLFLQISVSAGRSLLVGPQTLRRVAPYEEKISANFLMLGLPVNSLLPAEIGADEKDADELAVDKVDIATDKVVSEEAVLDKVIADEITTDEIAADEIAADEIATDEIATDEIATDDEVATNIADEVSSGTGEPGLTEPAATEDAKP